LLNSNMFGRAYLAYDASGDSTGLWRVRVRVAAKRTGLPFDTTVVDGIIANVNRTTSRLGPGWWISGIERLIRVSAASDSLLWVGGDGSTRLFVRASASKWFATETPVSPESLTVAGGVYTRYLKGGTRVLFQSSTGLHTQTINRLGHTTVVVYDTANGLARPRTIAVPPGGASLTYTFHYGGPTGWLDSVSAPVAPRVDNPLLPQVRTTRLLHDAGSGRVTSIAAVNGSRDEYLYHPTYSRLIVRKRDAIDVGWSFRYDSALRVAADSVNLGGTQFARTTITNAHMTALVVSASTIPAPLADTSMAYTTIDGPRTDGADVSLFWLNRFGAVTRTRDPYNFVTRLLRENATFPNLVTNVIYPNQRELVAAHDPRGNVLRVTDLSLCRSGRCSTTAYAYDPLWDEPTKVTYPGGDFVEMSYSASNGNMLWRQDGRGAMSRTDFGYINSAGAPAALQGMLDSVRAPADSAGQRALDRLAYESARGNVTTATSAIGYKTTYVSDAVGRTTAVRQDINLGDGAAQQTRDSVVFDALDRDSITLKLAPSGGPAAQVEVRKVFRADGAVDQIRRTPTPNPVGLTNLVTSFKYDSAKRVVAEYAPDGRRDSTVYDPAGNPVRTYSRRQTATDSQKVLMWYDRMNRLTRREVPATTQKRDTVAFSGGSLFFPFFQTTAAVVPGDTSTFSYDSLGRMIHAINASARVVRRYHEAGMLELDSLQIMPYSSTLTASEAKTVVIESAYDIAGRRERVALPTGAVGAFEIRYVYDSLHGQVSTVSSSGGVIALNYDSRLQLAQQVYGAPTVLLENTRYDADGRTIRRDRSVFENDSLWRDALGRLTHVKTNQDTRTFAYTGLGMVDTTSYALGAQTPLVERFSYDPLGNRLGMSSYADELAQDTMTYDAVSGRLLTHAINQQSAQSFYYDSSGNTRLSGMLTRTTSSAGVCNILSWTRTYYGVDQRPRVVDKQSAFQSKETCAGKVATNASAFEELRYDALGRRVLKRTRSVNCNGGACDGTVERTYWDGEQVLVETRYPGRDGISADSLEVDTGYVWYEDKKGVELPPPLPDTIYSREWGRIYYIHGPDLDRPLALLKEYHADSSFRIPSVLLYPAYDFRGLVSSAQGLNGLSDQQYKIRWPAKNSTVYLYDPAAGTSPSWFGSMIQSFSDASGKNYRRSRYYDPVTGRFTQEDPIGLAGGLNLYGYANGDPVNFADPFGLCPASMRDASGNCPGGLSVGQWDRVVYAANNRMTPEARAKVKRLLESGNIRAGFSLFQQARQAVKGSKPDATAWLGNVEMRESTFDFSPGTLAFVLGHEIRHLEQSGLSRGKEGDADAHACANTYEQPGADGKRTGSARPAICSRR